MEKQFFGLKFPFSAVDFNKFYVDLNSNLTDKVKSQLMHIVFTPKGQRVRMPEFGTDLIKYIFQPSDGDTWEAVKNEVSDAVSRWSDNLALNNIRVIKNKENEFEIFVRLDYSVTDGNKVANDSLIVKL